MEDNIKMKGDKGKRKGKKQNINPFSSKHIRLQEKIQEKPKKNNDTKKK